MMNRIVILGCGFVGARAARLFVRGGWDVTGVTRTKESAARLAGEPFKAMACDISGDLSGRIELQDADALISAVSPGRGGGEEAYRQVYLRGLENAIAGLKPKRVLFVSSTSVYAQNDGSWVTEESPAEPVTATSRILREAEEVALANGGQVARLAGIYGPGRSVLLRKFLDGTAVIEGDGTRHINQIHAEDAAGALYHMIARDLPPGIYNVVDDQPVTQAKCYGWMAERLGRPLPPHGPLDMNRKRGVTDKRVSNAKLRSLGWAPEYLSYREALVLTVELLAGAPGGGSGGARP
jgi:nucleoside-diphosphate-sugar epimerase